MDALRGQPDGGLVASGKDGRPVLHAAVRLGRTFNGFRPAVSPDAPSLPRQARYLVLIDPAPALSAAAARLGPLVPVTDDRVAIYRIGPSS